MKSNTKKNKKKKLSGHWEIQLCVRAGRGANGS